MSSSAERLASTWRDLIWLSRAREWWHFKLPPVFGTAYATAALLGLPIRDLWGSLTLLLAALVPAAVYANVLNDLTDLRQDQACGKPNRMVGRSRGFRFSVLIVAGLAGAGVAIMLTARPTALLVYFGIWVAFGLYSIRPIRLKERGAAGVLCDASGAHLFPQLFAVFLVATPEYDLPSAWPASVTVWALGCGMRNILWHQLHDADNDKLSGVATFVQRNSVQSALAVGRWVVFPVELAGLCSMLVVVNNPVTWVLLAAHLVVDAGRYWVWDIDIVIVAARRNQRIVLNEFYEVGYPLSLLVTAAWHDPFAGLVLAVHIALFHRHARRFLREASVLPRVLFKRSIGRTVQ